MNNEIEVNAEGKDVEVFVDKTEEYLIPPGGATGQILIKKSSADGDAKWGQDIYLANAYLDPNSDSTVLVLEMSNGKSFRIDLGSITPSTDISLLTSENEIFVTKNDENFILKEEELNG